MLGGTAENTGSMLSPQLYNVSMGGKKEVAAEGQRLEGVFTVVNVMKVIGRDERDAM